MLKTTFAAAVALSAFTALPTAAQAQHGYYDSGRYQSAYRGDRYHRGDRYYADRGYYRDYRSRYGNRRGYYRDRRCSGTTGTIVGGVAGALLGREVTRDSRGYRRNSGTTGAILGGALGALAGRAIDKSDCR
ncbi:glycine zipper 2TM domain-containing protein [Sphingosinicella rhizophila]|uniref:17 kDa surface antigen n=1 Tax=Sphingosinicella rhizophila TaxID=3050082 RepID=A0ABU3Q8V3_9SPHN|nr:glycine zipper 2TM domain-containing protein [Sphingosinicella sp. GR2756]MDT9599742.1 glycine zipper 2TM domain-containing protein [Sphingosinicella sp. GR2756]